MHHIFNLTRRQAGWKNFHLSRKVETIEILRQTNKSTASLAELKGITKTIPNQHVD
jgi:hypothetical protein